MQPAARLGVLLILPALLTGCGSLGGLASLLPGGSGGPASVTARPSAIIATLPPVAREIKTCELVPLAEVQARSPLREQLVISMPEDGIESRCRYNSSLDPPPDWPNSFLLSVQDFLTPEEALAALQASRDFADVSGYPITTISGVGDQALGYSESDYASYVDAVLGQYEAHVLVADSGNLQFPEVPSAEKVAAGADVIKFAFSQIQK